jgi:uncharacterized UBP type Zn finger protein
LIQSLWVSGKKRAINPTTFKKVVAKLNEQFAGNDQHDAQELLSFLLRLALTHPFVTLCVLQSTAVLNLLFFDAVV